MYNRPSYNARLMGNRTKPVEWHQYRWSWVTLKVTLAVWKLSNSHTSENIARINHMNRKAYAACNFNCLFETARKTCESHRQLCILYERSDGNISETVQDKHVVTNRLLLIGSDTWPIEWRQCWWPWVIFKVINLLQAFWNGIFFCCATFINVSTDIASPYATAEPLGPCCI